MTNFMMQKSTMRTTHASNKKTEYENPLNAVEGRCGLLYNDGEKHSCRNQHCIKTHAVVFLKPAAHGDAKHCDPYCMDIRVYISRISSTDQ